LQKLCSSTVAAAATTMAEPKHFAPKMLLRMNF